MDITTYALSKKIAAHALSGVQSMSVSGQTLTINTKDSGVLTMTFPTPKDGVSVMDIDVNANNQIVFTMSDGSEIISGKIPTVKGDKGDPGFSPTITENADNTDKIYKLDITTADSTFTTPNLKGADGQGGTGGSGEENIIDSISVNGVNMTPDENKNVDITVPKVTNDLTDELKSSYDEAVAVKHTHNNKTVLDSITAEKVESWDKAEENVQSDWNETDDTADGFIKNKPAIPDIMGLATETYVDNKVADYTKTVDLADVATSGSYNDLVDKPTIPSVDGLVSEDTLNTTLGTKVDKVNGKGLSTNDLTDDLKASYDDAVDKVHTHPDPLAEKTVVFLGDSITVGLRWQTEIGDTTNKYGWAKIIQEHFPTATVKNLAISGACIANTGSYIDVIMQYHSMSNTENAEYYTPNPDYIIFSGGGNDGLQTITMGTICDGFAPSISNTNTTIGALEYMFADCYNKYPTARKGFIITQRITDAVEEYYDAIRNVCQKWSIPVLDLSRVGEINAFIDGIATTYFTKDDRVHPNEKCYREILAPKVEKWLMSQMI